MVDFLDWASIIWLAWGIFFFPSNKGLCAKSSMVHNLNLMKYLGHKVNGGVQWV
jgi:hypothetical protein